MPTTDHGFFVNNAWLIPFLPLLGALIAAAAGRQLRGLAHIPVVAGIGLAFLVSLGAFASAGPEVTAVATNWLTVSGLDVPIEMRVDGLSTMMMSMVTFVSCLVAIFAIGYMSGDPGYPRFFALIGLFVFSMTGLVLSNNYLLTYVFWEGVGACSYLLIGFWYARPSAAAAAMKAFLVNRVGDFGFAIAIFWLWTVSPGHDLSYGAVFEAARSEVIPHSAVVGIALLFFWGATAKSAQIPLYTWLPDAMEGPTPVSALIHAATMVTAGVYLIARSMPMISLAPGVQVIIAVTGCLTALLSAAIALTQFDLKRVMAYSTVSQLGYMFMALGSGVGDVAQLAVVAAMFHLFTHAFFKALLFLASGSVMHAMGDVIDMRRFGGLRHRMPVTYWTFLVGGLSLAAILPLSGFFSKDEILAAISGAAHSSHELHLSWGWIYNIIFLLALGTAFLTAFYTFRAFFMTFHGPEKLPSPDDPEVAVAADAHGHDAHTADAHGHGHHEIGHESPPVMTVPLMILAGCTVLIGFICLLTWLIVGGPAEWFGRHLEKTLAFETLPHAEHSFSWVNATLGLLVGVGGIWLAYIMYGKPSPLPGRVRAASGPLYRASLNKFYVDEIYGVLVVGLVRAISWLSGIFDDYVVDRLVTGIALLPRAIARARLAATQNGLIQHYAAGSAISVALLLVVIVFGIGALAVVLGVLAILLYIGSRPRSAAVTTTPRVIKADGDV
ncbi:MAG: NADH-quinone oxidoreductase subunit L [Isosphaeraceae bacterium]